MAISGDQSLLEAPCLYGYDFLALLIKPDLVGGEEGVGVDVAHEVCGFGLNDGELFRSECRQYDIVLAEA